MIRTIALATGALASMTLASMLSAGEAKAPPTQPTTAAAREVPQFSSLDVNADTMISAEEAKAHPGLAAIFAECDADSNGSLSTWEFAEARSKLDK